MTLTPVSRSYAIDMTYFNNMSVQTDVCVCAGCVCVGGGGVGERGGVLINTVHAG